MSTNIIYLDYAAGTPIDKSILRNSLRIAEKYPYNPSALYQGAVVASQRLEVCRQRLAKILAVKASSLFFTAGATEANNLVALSLRRTYPQARLAGLSIDHDSWRLNLDQNLAINSKTAQVLESAILDLPDNVCCLSLAGINNQLGVIQPFSVIKKALKKVRIRRQSQATKLPLWLHIDASQMALVHKLQPQALAEADFMTLNGAKFYAFKQSGLLYIKKPLAFKQPFKGGEQESGWRPGGESLLLAEALTEALIKVNRVRLKQSQRLKDLQKWFEVKLETLGGQIVLKQSSARSPLITNVIFAKTDNQRLAMQLSDLGIYVGIGSACHSQTDLWQTSSLKALGYSREQIYASLRFSFAYQTNRRQLTVVLKHLKKLLSL